MKIAIFSDNFYPEISGISDSIILLGEELTELGHEVHYFAARYSTKDHQKANLPDEELEMGEKIKFHRFWSLPFLGSPTGQSRIVLPFGLRVLRYRKEKFDVIYTQSPYGMGMEALLMSWLLRIPLVGTNHTPITEFTSYLPLSNKFFDWLGLNFVSWYYNRCKFVTAPYGAILDEMKKYGFRRESMELSNPIDLKNFVPAMGEEKKELKHELGLSQKTVLYAGRLAPEKQVDIIVRAMTEVKKEIPEAMLAITGIGNAENDLKKLAENLGIKDSVKFFGRVDDQTHAQTYRAAEIFVVMSTAETQCISMMKAMSSGVPVIGADAWALPSYIGRDERLGFVVPVGDAKMLAEKIILLFKDEKKAQQMGNIGIEYAKQFSARKVAEKWEEIFGKYLK